MGRRWSPRSKLFAGLATVCALAAFLLVSGYAKRLQAMEPGAPAGVVVAARDLSRGARIEPEMVRVREMPSAFAPPGATRTIAEVSGHALLAPVSEGEVITDTRIGPGAGPVATLVPAGLRAVTVPTSLPEGVVATGDRVDVLATYTGGQPYTEVAGEGLEVLGVIPSTAGGLGEGASGPTLVLLTDADGAERLAHALAFADIGVAVLGHGEVTQTPQPPTAQPTPSS